MKPAAIAFWKAATVATAITLVFLLGQLIVTSIYYAGKSDGWVEGFERCEEIRNDA